MKLQLIDHAARVLKRSATHTLPADLLYERVRAEAGTDVGLGGFVAALRAEEDRFAVLLPPLVPAEQTGWGGAERTAYEQALAAAGLQAPVVVLAERRTGAADDGAVMPAPPRREGEAGGGEEPPDLLCAARAAVTELLGAVPDGELRCALDGALGELDAARRVLEAGS